MANEYDVGDTVRLRHTLTDAGNQPVDPAAIYLVIKQPNGPTLTYEHSLSEQSLTRESKGVYRMDFRVRLPGNHQYNVLVQSKDGTTNVTQGEFVAKPVIAKTRQILETLP